ncbi:hypothetical protein OZX72_05335 [Bifidobacterium sp. ESL0769]|uniref:hypothetical protein n=1 Tax=Bifidobacterium sp. ESL0769 TaxID=2983229 RepID=UPI0023F99D32|nr:hypothetical protein [Bifidobacterium sp. ESL0769]WEV66697.1 hypothetical protein OZX72_05335 [Bifidobacterium sp. ESL0769]
MTSLNMATTKKVALLLASARGIDFLHRAHYVSGMPVICADCDEPMATVLSRVSQHGEDNTLLVVDFVRRGCLYAAVISRVRAKASCEELRMSDGAASSIGMLFDYLKLRKDGLDVVIEHSNSIPKELESLDVSEMSNAPVAV